MMMAENCRLSMNAITPSIDSIHPNHITGVVLAGGRGRRMGGEDKGLLPFRGQPLVNHALAALGEVAGTRLINANRNLDAYAALGFRVVPDASETFDGPLAGLLSAMRAAATPYVLTVPCDTPLLTGALLQRLIVRLVGTGAAMAVATDGERLHPVVMLAETGLAEDLQAYLDAGERKVEHWIRRQRWVSVDFSDAAGALANINTPDDLARLETRDLP
jgi:molybdopterin-guanine dinucleotide biosynthesis protein A